MTIETITGTLCVIVVESPALEVFKQSLEMVLSAMV